MVFYLGFGRWVKCGSTETRGRTSRRGNDESRRQHRSGRVRSSVWLDSYLEYVFHLTIPNSTFTWASPLFGLSLPSLHSRLSQFLSLHGIMGGYMVLDAAEANRASVIRHSSHNNRSSCYFPCIREDRTSCSSSLFTTSTHRMLLEFL